MVYAEQLDLSRRRKCLVSIGVIDCTVFARMLFFNNGKWTHNITIHKDTDDKVIVPHCTFPDYVKKVLDVLSQLVLPSIYYKECVFDETR